MTNIVGFAGHQTLSAKAPESCPTTPAGMRRVADGLEARGEVERAVRLRRRADEKEARLS